MAIDIKFDLVGNPELPTIILATRNGNKLGQLNVNADSIELIDKLNDASEFTFTLNKYVDGKLANLWDKVTNFKLVYCKEWDLWFEITVELDEETETVKTVFCTQLGQAELSQIMLYNIEINTEEDIARDDYKITILYDAFDHEASLLHRLLKDKAPHYSIIHVDSTIAKIQRSFSFDDTSIYDAFQEIAEEIGCLFVFHSNSDENGKIQRTISVYDLESNCNDCGHRGEFIGVCPECGSTKITEGYGEDTTIFVTADELADNIQLTTDTDAVKNCFKLEAGDDLMTATIRNCNPNGTDYIWYISDVVKEDMSPELVKKLEEYDALYDYYQKEYSTAKLISKNQAKVLTVGTDVQVGDVLKFTSLNTDKNASIFIIYSDGAAFGYALNTSQPTHDLIVSDEETIEISENIETYLISHLANTTDYNNLVKKYKVYNENLAEIPMPIQGYPALMQAYYNTVDLELYLKTSLMPTIEMSNTSAQAEADKLISSNLSSVSTENISYLSSATADNIVLSMAKILVDSRYKVEIDESSYDDNTKTWSGTFLVTNYSEKEDVATSTIATVFITDDYGNFVQQKIDKLLNKEDTDDLSISGLFAKSDNEFAEELKKYSLDCLKSFHNSCQSCIDILIEQGVGNKETWSGQDPNLYEDLYVVYLNKLGAIEYEMKVRQDELDLIVGVRNINGELQTYGLQNYIEEIQEDIHSKLNFENYLGSTLWLEFCSFRREDKYSNSNYISDGLNNAELFDNALEFVKVATKEIYKSAELQHSISSSLKNLLAIKKFAPLVNNFKVGNWLRILIDDEIYKLRLIEYSIDYGDFDNISVEFSDVMNLNSATKKVQGVLEQAAKMATSYDTVQKQAQQGEASSSILDNWSTKGLDTTNTKIIQGADNQTQTWDEHGMLFKKYDEVTDSYSDTQLKIVNSTMAITDDNWKTVKTAVGEYYYFDPIDGSLKKAYGVNAEVLVGKLILGEQLGIYNQTGSLTFDNNGFEITNGVNSFRVNPDADMLLSISNMVKNEETGIEEEKKVFYVDKEGGLYIDGSGVDISGNVVFTSFKEDLKNGNTVISGGCITTGTIAAEYIETDELTVKMANVTGTLKADRIKLGDSMEVYESLSSTTVGGYLGYTISSLDETAGMHMRSANDLAEVVVTDNGAKMMYLNTNNQIYIANNAMGISVGGTEYFHIYGNEETAMPKGVWDFSEASVIGLSTASGSTVVFA